MIEINSSNCTLVSSVSRKGNEVKIYAKQFAKKEMVEIGSR